MNLKQLGDLRTAGSKKGLMPVFQSQSRKADALMVDCLVDTAAHSRAGHSFGVNAYYSVSGLVAFVSGASPGIMIDSTAQRIMVAGSRIRDAGSCHPESCIPLLVDCHMSFGWPSCTAVITEHRHSLPALVNLFLPKQPLFGENNHLL